MLKMLHRPSGEEIWTPSFSEPEGKTGATLNLEGLKKVFSIEMKSKKYVKSISISDEDRDRVLFEGDLGELRELTLSEGDVLEFIGVNGILRIGLTEEQLRKTLAYKRQKSSLSSEVGSYRSTKKKGDE
jgi:hypothetical protein